MYTALKFFPSD